VPAHAKSLKNSGEALATLEQSTPGAAWPVMQATTPRISACVRQLGSA
jgi:hypothetical protein